MKILIYTTKIVIGLLLLSSINKSSFSQTGWVQLNTGTTNNLTYVKFIDANTGYLMNPLRKTINGGLNWTLVPAIPPNSVYIDWVDANTGFIIQNIYLGIVNRTENGGNNWVIVDTSYLKRISFANYSTGYGTGNGYQDEMYKYFKKTTDGGLSWTSCLTMYIPFSQAQFHYWDVFTISPDTVYFCFDYEEIENINYRYSRIYRSKSGGSNWEYFQIDSLIINGISCPSVDTAYAFGHSRPPYLTPYYHVLKGINNNWVKIFTAPDTSIIKEICFPTNNIGYVIWDNNNIHKTTNGGINWYSVNSENTQSLNQLFFLNSSTGFVAGDSGILLKTTTGGIAPVYYNISGTVKYQDNQQPVTSGYVKALKFNRSTGIMTTMDSSQILSNGTYILPHITQDTVDVMAFENDEEELSFVPTYYPSTIFWENATHLYPTGNLTNINIGVFRINPPSGPYHIGGGVFTYGEYDYSGSLRDAIVYARIGNVFKGYSISIPGGNYCIDSLPAGNYEIICNRMGYYSSLRPLQITSFSMDTIDFYLSNLLVKIEDPGSLLPEKYVLYQNYPNPFNPSTKIRFAIPSSALNGVKSEKSNVRLTIYDVLGREVAALINEQLQSGTYEVTWNASNHPSGIYFYKLQAGNYVETKKMVLIK